MLQVQQAGSDEELRRVLGSNEYDFRFLCGYAKPLAYPTRTSSLLAYGCIMSTFQYMQSFNSLKMVFKVRCKLEIWFVIILMRCMHC